MLLLCSALYGCPPAHAPDRGIAPPGGLAGAGASLEVRRANERPALTLLVREGDPEPALVVAVAVGLGSRAAVALATLMEQRLRAAGFAVRSEVDRLGFRLVLSPAEPAAMAAFMTALGRAFAAPMVVAEPAGREIAARWAALDRHPWPGRAFDAVAACTGALGVAESQSPAEPAPTTAAGASLVESWRSRVFAADRAALAAVGSAELGNAVARALEQSAPWPRRAAPWPPSGAQDADGVYFAAGADHDAWRMTLAFTLHDPERAASVAHRLGEPDSPLRVKLATGFEPWTLEHVRLTVSPAGGCVAAELTTATRQGSSPAAAASAAADVARLTRKEVTAELGREPDRFVAVRSIIAPPRAAEAAARAAWWSLAGAAPPRTPPMAAVLELGTGRGGPGEHDLREIERAFHAQLERADEPGAANRPDHRLAVERGQGELWALVASTCATADETPSQAGLAALGAIAAAAGADGVDGVRVEAWVGPAGVGVLAHALPNAATETPAELAVRVGRAAGRAFAAGPGRLETFVAARRRLVDELYGPEEALRADLARAAIPGQASRLAPLGPPEHGKQADIERARKRWQEVVRGPIRIAVLGNSDATQTKRASEEIERWLWPLGRAQACAAEGSATSDGRGGLYRTSGAPVGDIEPLAWATIVARPSPEQRHMADLTAAALDGADGLLAAALGALVAPGAVSVHLLEWSDALALVVSLETERVRVEAVDARVGGLFEELRTRGIGEGQAARARRAAAARRAMRLADPRARLELLWNGGPGVTPSALPDGQPWRQWLGELLRADRLVRLRATAPPP